MVTQIETVREIVGADEESFIALERILDANEGDLTPGAVVTEARNPESPLHHHFEWDNAKAADAHRLNQARALIQSYRLHVVDERGERTVRFYSNVVIRDEHTYRRTEEILRIDGLREQRRMKLVKELTRLQGDLKAFDEHSAAVRAIQTAIDTLNGAEKPTLAT